MHRDATPELHPATRPPPAPEPLLQLTDIVRNFPSGEGIVQVLKHVDLSIAAGEMVAIVGASGAGKSMLMNLLGCLDRPTSGRYTVAGVDVATLSGDELARLRREHFGFIFQRYHLMPHLTATENVEVPAIYAGAGRGARRERALQLLARLGLADRTTHRPSQLSGGQQQRVSIARALMNGGQVILADEPTGALDSHSGEEMLAILRELHAQGHTIIIVTHDMNVASLADRIVEIADGEIVADYPNPARPAALPEAEPAVALGACRTFDARAAKALTTVHLRSDFRYVAPLHASSPHATGLVSAPFRLRARKSDRLLAALPARSRVGGWDRFVEAFRMALRSMAAHRMRTALTMLGIVIGITSVVSIAALGEGARRMMLADMRAVAANLLDIYPGNGPGDDRANTVRTLSPGDVEALRAQPYVHSVTPASMRQLRLRYREVDVSASVSGVNESYFDTRNIAITKGAALDEAAVRRHEQVVVIDENTRAKLFGPEVDPVGKIILIANLPCTVIGVADEKRMMGDRDKTLKAWVPYTMAAGRLFGQQHFDGIIVRLQDDQPPKAAEDGVVKLLTMRHGTRDFFVFNSDSMFKMVEQTSQAMTLLLSLIAAISLLVGGIGVMNIMLVSVTERTREIGIRMAVGARQGDVLQQFLTEAVVVCLASGAIGIALSYAASFLFTPWKMVYSTGAIVLAFTSATLIGVIFGYVPARNAARLNPIDALARE